MEIDLEPDMAVIEALKLVVYARKRLRDAGEHYLDGQVEITEKMLKDGLRHRLGERAMRQALGEKE